MSLRDRQINNSIHLEMEGSLLLSGMNLQVKVHRNWTHTLKICADLSPAGHLMQRSIGMNANCSKTDLNPGVFVSYKTSLRLHKHTNRHTNTRLWLTTLLRVSEEKWKSLSPEIKAVVQIKRSNSSIQIGVCSHTTTFNTAKSDHAKTLETVWMLRFRYNWWY